MREMKSQLLLPSHGVICSLVPISPPLKGCDRVVEVGVVERSIDRCVTVSSFRF